MICFFVNFVLSLNFAYCVAIEDNVIFEFVCADAFHALHSPFISLHRLTMFILYLCIKNLENFANFENFKWFLT